MAYIQTSEPYVGATIGRPNILKQPLYLKIKINY